MMLMLLVYSLTLAFTSYSSIYNNQDDANFIPSSLHTPNTYLIIAVDRSVSVSWPWPGLLSEISISHCPDSVPLWVAYNGRPVPQHVLAAIRGLPYLLQAPVQIPTSSPFSHHSLPFRPERRSLCAAWLDKPHVPSLSLGEPASQTRDTSGAF